MGSSAEGRLHAAMTLWTNSEGGCLACCVASLAECHPADVEGYDHGNGDVDLEGLDSWLAGRGKRLELVWPAETWGESYPRGDWIALLARNARVGHAVLCRGSRITHDPGISSGWTGNLWPRDLAAAHYREWPLGLRVVSE